VGDGLSKLDGLPELGAVNDDAESRSADDVTGLESSNVAERLGWGRSRPFEIAAAPEGSDDCGCVGGRRLVADVHETAKLERGGNAAGRDRFVGMCRGKLEPMICAGFGERSAA